MATKAMNLRQIIAFFRSIGDDARDEQSHAACPAQLLAPNRPGGESGEANWRLRH
jgi:hypothetical protein